VYTLNTEFWYNTFDCAGDTVLQAQETSSTPTVDKRRVLEEKKARIVDKVDTLNKQ